MNKYYHSLVCLSILLTAFHAIAHDGFSPKPADLPSGHYFGEADFAHAEALGFSTLALSTPKSFKFYRSNAISMNLTAKGAGITLGQYCQILPSSSPSNPSHVAGIRSFFEVDYAAGVSPAAASTATIEITFATGLPTSGYLLFMDFDANERIDIKAYNASNGLIPYSDMTFTRENGRVASGSPSTAMKWDDLGAAYTGRIYESGGSSATFPMMTLKSNQEIKRLVYEVNMNPGASAGLSNTMWFNFVTPTVPATVYVNHAAAGANNGTSWANAYTSLQTGIDNAFPGDQVWVAKGTYKPSSAYERTNTSRFYHFRLPNSVSIYGGFVSGQTATSQRSDYGIGGANETVMSGDLSGDDNYTTLTNLGDNTYHVIYHPVGTCLGTGTRLEGVTILGGNADATSGDTGDGGAAYLTENTSIRFADVNFYRNTSYDDGGAMYLINGGNKDSSRVYFTGCTFRNNRTTNTAGHGTLYCTDDSEASVVNVEFRENTVSGNGGGIAAFNRTALTLQDVTLANNTAGTIAGGLLTEDAGTAVNATGLMVTGNSASTSIGGGISCRLSSSFTGTNMTVSGNTAGTDGGGIAVEDASTTVNLTNLLLSGNTASGDDGGGIYVYDALNVTINNGTIAGNLCKDDGGGVRAQQNTSTNPGIVLNNCIIWGNRANGTAPNGFQIFRGGSSVVTLNHTIYKNGTGDMEGTGTLTLGSGNLTTDPLFRNSVTGDYRITSGSPAADAGNGTYNSQTTDIRGTGFGRKLLKTDAATAGTIDMGAYEYHAVTDANKSWTNGVGNHLWNVAGNWSDNAVPHSNDIIEVASGTPRLNVDFTTDRSITLSGTSTLTIQPTAGLSVGATGTLALGGRPVTFKSDATGTARMGQVSGTLTGATNVTVERYIPAGRKWRFLCAPLTGASPNNSIFYNWQNNDVPNGATGVEIWGPAPNGANDPSSANNGLALGANYSMRNYDAVWQNVTNTNTTYLFDGTTNYGFALFQTGPYNNGSTAYIGNSTSLPAGVATTLSATGSLITGDHAKSFTAATAGQYFLVANPYASPVNPNSFTGGNISNLYNTLYMWDAKPGNGINRGLGRYVSYTISGSTYSNGGSGTGYPDNTQIQSGQAFFVRAINAGGASLVFKESSKSSSASHDMLGSSTSSADRKVRLFLQEDSTHIDGAVAFFRPGASAGIDADDGQKLMNATDNLGLRREGRTLVFEFRPELKASDTLFATLTQMQPRSFRLRVALEGFKADDGVKAELVDRHLQQRTPLSLTDTTDLDFSVTADSASSGGRFLIVFTKSATTGGGLAEPAVVAKMNPYPNPVVSGLPVRVDIDGAKAPWSLQLIDIAGRTVWQQTMKDPVQGRVEIDMSRMGAGVYQLLMTDGKGTQSLSRVVKP